MAELAALGLIGLDECERRGGHVLDFSVFVHLCLNDRTRQSRFSGTYRPFEKDAIAYSEMLENGLGQMTRVRLAV